MGYNVNRDSETKNANTTDKPPPLSRCKAVRAEANGSVRGASGSLVVTITCKGTHLTQIEERRAGQSLPDIIRPTSFVSAIRMPALLCQRPRWRYLDLRRGRHVCWHDSIVLAAFLCRSRDCRLHSRLRLLQPCVQTSERRQRRGRASMTLSMLLKSAVCSSHGARWQQKHLYA